jgi:MoaA/NifB/PqqE/SkfB family radical SAM enzyme
VREWLGPVEVQIAGGEPLLAENLLKLVACARAESLAVTMTTNGFALTAEMAQRLAAAGLQNLALSIDGFTEVHNRIRNREDAFALAERAMHHATDNGMKVRVTCVICEANLETLPGLVTWVRDEPRLEGIFFQAMVQPFGRPPQAGWWREEPLFPKDGARAAAVLAELLQMKEAGFPILNPDEQFGAMGAYFCDPDRFALTRCNVGAFGLTIEGSGAIKLCGGFEPIGDLREGHHLRDVYRGPRAEAVRAQMSACERNCHLVLNCCFDTGAVS